MDNPQVSPIVGFENYMIDLKGNVFGRTGKRLCQPLNKRGYCTVSLYPGDLAVRGNLKTKLVHRLVGETFLPNPLNLPQINHIDGNKLNNSIQNLEWVSDIKNQFHAVKNDLTAYGINNHNAKLNDELVHKICDLRINYGLTHKAIAQKFNLNVRTVGSILAGRTWVRISTLYGIPDKSRNKTNILRETSTTSRKT